GRVQLPALGGDLDRIRRIAIIACGSSYYAGLGAKYWIEQLARVPGEGDLASEVRHRGAPPGPDIPALFIPQSGETLRTPAALRHAKAEGAAVAAVVNVPTSTMAREAGAVLPTLAGPEIGVASTKAFMTQLGALACFAIGLGEARGTLAAERVTQLT